MMEAIAGFFVGLTVSWWFWIPLMGAILFLDYQELRGGFSGFGMLLGIAALWALFSVITFHLWYLLLYPVIGFAWSLWRYKRFVATRLKSVDPSEDMRFVRDNLGIQNQAGRVAYWILMWPTNMIVNVFADVWDTLIHVLQVRLAGLFNSILEREISK